jgi:hypothetical protein
MTDAIKVYLAYWAFANLMGNFQFLAPITDIMSVAKNVNRESSWSSTEKKRFWDLSKLLENTKLTFKYKLNDEWIDVKIPMLDLSVTASQHKDQELKNGYPDKVIPRVLNPLLKEAAYLVTEISKGTLSLRPEDILLGLFAQSRAAQRKTSEKQYTTIDEEFAMKLAGLSGTYKSNPRMARKKFKEKLNKITAANSISGYEIKEDGAIRLDYRKSPIKNSKKTTKKNNKET